MNRIELKINDDKTQTVVTPQVLVEGENLTTEIALIGSPVSWAGSAIRALITTPMGKLVDAVDASVPVPLTNTMLDGKGTLYVEYVAMKDGAEIARTKSPALLPVSAARSIIGDIDPAPLPDLVAEMVAAKGDCDSAAALANDRAFIANGAAQSCAQTEQDIEAAEALRAAAEQSRASAEGTRTSNEAARGTAEGNRATAESTRQTAESNRATAEATRGNAETERASAETARVNAETGRVSAETARVATASNDHSTAVDDRSRLLIRRNAITISTPVAAVTISQGDDGLPLSGVEGELRISIPAGLAVANGSNAMIALQINDIVGSYGNLYTTNSSYASLGIARNGYSSAAAKINKMSNGLVSIFGQSWAQDAANALISNYPSNALKIAIEKITKLNVFNTSALNFPTGTLIEYWERRVV